MELLLKVFNATRYITCKKYIWWNLPVSCNDNHSRCQYVDGSSGVVRVFLHVTAEVRILHVFVKLSIPQCLNATYKKWGNSSKSGVNKCKCKQCRSWLSRRPSPFQTLMLSLFTGIYITLFDWLLFILYIHFKQCTNTQQLAHGVPQGTVLGLLHVCKNKKKTQNRNAKKGLALLKCKWKFIWINSRRKGSVLSLVPGHDTQNRPSWTHSTFSWITAIQCWQTRCQSAAG